MTLFAISFDFLVSKKRETLQDERMTPKQNLIVGIIWFLFTLNLMHAVSA